MTLDRHARQQVQPVTVLKGPWTMTSRPRPVRSRRRRHSVKPKVQAKKLMHTPAAHVEPLGNLIEREPDDRPQAEHLKLSRP